ncbi:MAG: hypothetical protein ACLPTF_08735 [Steroidobacteraceae bacterium]
MTAQGKWKIMIKTPLGDKEGDRIQGKAKYLLGSASFSGSRI